MDKAENHLRIAVNTTCTADVDNYSWLLVLDAEVRRRLSYQSEGSCVMHGKHGFPLLVGHLVMI